MGMKLSEQLDIQRDRHNDRWVWVVVFAYGVVAILAVVRVVVFGLWRP